MSKLIFTVFILASLWGNAQENTLLSAAFWKAKPTLEQVKALINEGNNPAEFNPANNDPVSIAILNGASLDLVKFLIEQEGNSVAKKTHDGRLYLHWAAYKGDITLVKYLISKGSSITEKDDKSATPLGFAASSGQANPELYEVFFDAGIDPNETYAAGANILHLGIGGDRDLKLSDYLATKGLSLKQTDDLGGTTFDYAARMGSVELLQKILSRGVEPTHRALLFAAQGARSYSAPLEVYRFLIEELHLNPNTTGVKGETVLHYLSMKKNHEDIIAYFLSKNTDVNRPDNAGNTPFMNASKTNNISVVRILYPKVKTIDRVNDKGESALHLAVQTGSPEIVNFLISNQADTKMVAKIGNLAFSLVNHYKKPRNGDDTKAFEEKLKILEQNDLDFSAKDNYGATLYHIAVTKDDLHLLQLLEGKGIDVNAQDHNGMTALHKAASMAKSEEILRYLIAQGADRHLKTDLDETAYDLAKDNEFLKSKAVNIEFLK